MNLSKLLTHGVKEDAEIESENVDYTVQEQVDERHLLNTRLGHIEKRPVMANKRRNLTTKKLNAFKTQRKADCDALEKVAV